MDLEFAPWLVLALLWFWSAWYEARSRSEVLLFGLAGLFFVIAASYEYRGYDFSWRLALAPIAVLLLAFYFAYRVYREHGPAKGLVTWWRWWRGRESE